MSEDTRWSRSEIDVASGALKALGERHKNYAMTQKFQKLRLNEIESSLQLAKSFPNFL